MKHEGPKSGRKAQQPRAESRGAVRGGAQDAKAGLVGRSYRAGEALRAHDHGGELGGLGGEAGSSLEARATDLHARHGAALAQGAAEIGVAPEAIAAVVLAETGLLGPGADGPRAPIRFEPHAFYERTGRWLVATHKDQGAEYAAFDQARALDADAAHQSLRVGVGQVSGAEAEAAGFDSPQDMLARMHGDEAAQVSALVNLAGHDSGLGKALGAQDWAQVASLRAGPAYAAVGYDEALASYAAAYARVTGAAYGGDDDGEDDKKRRRRRD